MTDTRPIPVRRLCAWCKINLSAIPDAAVYYRGYAVHPPCAQAAAAEDAANAAEAETRELVAV